MTRSRSSHLNYERLARESVMENPDDLNATRLMPACLHVDFLARVIEAAVELGVLKGDDDDDDDDARVFRQVRGAARRIRRNHSREPR